jgi:hypothetical protein
MVCLRISWHATVNPYHGALTRFCTNRRFCCLNSNCLTDSGLVIPRSAHFTPETDTIFSTYENSFPVSQELRTQGHPGVRQLYETCVNLPEATRGCIPRSRFREPPAFTLFGRTSLRTKLAGWTGARLSDSPPAVTAIAHPMNVLPVHKAFHSSSSSPECDSIQLD